jgi:tetratricopeptide (TPR) repeat protein
LAVAEFREALRIDTNDVEAHFNLGIALSAQGKTDLAIAEYRDALRIKPDFAEALCGLGLLLRNQGRFRESMELLERGHGLGSQRPDWRHPSEEWVRESRRLLDLEAKVSAILKGGTMPDDAAELLALSGVCHQMEHYATAAEWAEEAFARMPRLADEMAMGSRYNAACSAALAGSGAGKASPIPDEAAHRARLREKARDWLRADLAAWTKALDGGDGSARQKVVETLVHWKEDADLAGIRDEAALAKLPDGEQEGFRALWAEVDRLMAKARAGAP